MTFLALEYIESTLMGSFLHFDSMFLKCPVLSSNGQKAGVPADSVSEYTFDQGRGRSGVGSMMV